MAKEKAGTPDKPKPMKRGAKAERDGSRHVTFRASDKDYALIEALMNELGVTRTDVLLLGLRSLSAPEFSRMEWLHLLAELDELQRIGLRTLIEVKKIGVNVNQIARRAHVTGLDVDSLTQAHDELLKAAERFDEETNNVLEAFFEVTEPPAVEGDSGGDS